MDDIYVFSDEQLKVLLSGCGFSRISGIKLYSSEIDDNATIRTLNKLVLAGILFPTDGKFVLRDDIKSIITVLGNAENYDVIHSKFSILPDLCCYRGEKLLVCSSRNHNINQYDFYFADAEELFENLEGQGYFPAEPKEDLFYENSLEEFEKDKMISDNSDYPLENSSSVIFSIELSLKDRSEYKYMKIIEYYFFIYILFYDGKNKKRFLYKAKKAKEIFKALMEC